MRLLRAISSQANTTVQLRRNQGSSTPVFCKPEFSYLEAASFTKLRDGTVQFTRNTNFNMKQSMLVLAH